MQAPRPAWLPLGVLLVRERLITHEQLEEALMVQQGMGRRLGELLVEWGWVTARDISQALAEQYELEYIDLHTTPIDEHAARRITADQARSFGALPIAKLPDGRLLVGVADPTDIGSCEHLRSLLGAIRLAVVDQTELGQATEQILGSPPAPAARA